jgi:hypothetical protein
MVLRFALRSLSGLSSCCHRARANLNSFRLSPVVGWLHKMRSPPPTAAACEVKSIWRSTLEGESAADYAVHRRAGSESFECRPMMALSDVTLNHPVALQLLRAAPADHSLAFLDPRNARTHTHTHTHTHSHMHSPASRVAERPLHYVIPYLIRSNARTGGATTTRHVGQVWALSCGRVSAAAVVQMVWI